MAEEDEPQLPKLRIMHTCPIDFGECKKKEEIEKEFNPSQVFLDIPYSGYNKEYENAIKKAIKSFGLTPVLAELDNRQDFLMCHVCSAIQKCGFAVADISKIGTDDDSHPEFNPNVLYELGLIHAVGKKCCILCHKSYLKERAVDLEGLLVQLYKNEQDIENKISKWIADNVEEITIRTAKQMNIFNVIFYQLDRLDFRGIDERIDELKEIGDIVPKNKYNQLVDSLIDFLNSNNPGIQSDAAYLLGKIRDCRAINPLIDALKNKEPSVRKKAVYALGEINDPKALKQIIELMKDKAPNVRNEVIKTLLKFKDPRTVKPLIVGLEEKLLSIKHEGKKPLANLLKNLEISEIISIITVLGEIGDIRAVETLFLILNDKNQAIRKEAEKALIKMGEGVVEPIIDMMENYEKGHKKSPPIKTILSILGSIASSKGTSYILKYLDSSDEYTQGDAIKALIDIGDERAKEPLLSLLDEEEIWKEGIIRALGNIGTEDIAPYLYKYIDTDDEFLNYEAIRALGKIGTEESFNPLWESFITDITDDRRDQQREEITDTLKIINKYKLEDKLLDLLHSEDRAIRYEAIKCIWKVATDKSMETLFSLLKDDYCRYKAEVALEVISHESILPRMNDLLKSKNAFEREQAVYYLWHKAKLTDIDILKSLQKDKSKLVKKAVAWAYYEMGNEECLQHLFEMAHDKAKSVKKEAIWYIDSIGSSKIIPLLEKKQKDAKSIDYSPQFVKEFSSNIINFLHHEIKTKLPDEETFNLLVFEDWERHYFSKTLGGFDEEKKPEMKRSLEEMQRLKQSVNDELFALRIWQQISDLVEEYDQ